MSKPPSALWQLTPKFVPSPSGTVRLFGLPSSNMTAVGGREHKCKDNNTLLAFKWAGACIFLWLYTHLFAWYACVRIHRDEWRFNRSDVLPMFFISHMITKTLIFAAMERRSNSRRGWRGDPPHTFTVGYIAVCKVTPCTLCLLRCVFPPYFYKKTARRFAFYARAVERRGRHKSSVYWRGIAVM